MHCQFYRVSKKPCENHKNTPIKVNPGELLAAEVVSWVRQENNRKPAGHQVRKRWWVFLWCFFCWKENGPKLRSQACTALSAVPVFQNKHVWLKTWTTERWPFALSFCPIGCGKGHRCSLNWTAFSLMLPLMVAHHQGCEKQSTPLDSEGTTGLLQTSAVCGPCFCDACFPLAA